MKLQDKIKLAWWDFLCGMLGHRWVKHREHNLFVERCDRCWRQRYWMTPSPGSSGKSEWQIGN